MGCLCKVGGNHYEKNDSTHQKNWGAGGAWREQFFILFPEKKVKREGLILQVLVEGDKMEILGRGFK